MGEIRSARSGSQEAARGGSPLRSRSSPALQDLLAGLQCGRSSALRRGGQGPRRDEARRDRDPRRGDPHFLADLPGPDLERTRP